MTKTLTLGALAVAALAAVAIPMSAEAASGKDGWFHGRGDRDGMREHGGQGGMGGQDGPRGAMAARMMERFDTDKDGKVTQAEIDAVQAQRFAGANTDGQPGVTIAEFEPAFWGERREMMVRAFQRLDQDGDGVVTEEEFNRPTAEMVSRMDRNDDGALSRDDRGGRHGDGRHGDGRRGPMPPPVDDEEPAATTP